MLANRIHVMSPCFTHKDQVGFVRGKQSTDGTRWLFNLLDITNKIRVLVVFLSLDIKKVFHGVQWCFLDLIQKKFGLLGYINSAMVYYSCPFAFCQKYWYQTEMLIVPLHFDHGYGSFDFID